MSVTVSPNTVSLLADNYSKRPKFLSLPLEIRQLVYRYIFSHGSVSFHNFKHEIVILPPCTNINILFINKTVHNEATPIFYELTKFCLGPDKPDLSLNGPTYTDVRVKFGNNAQHVRHVYYTGTDAKLVSNLHSIFPKLKLFEMSLGDDFYHSDQISFDRAMRDVFRYGNWKWAVKSALDDMFHPGMRDAVAVLKYLGSDKRRFRVMLHWFMAYRFVEFKGEVDLDEWILRVWDPAGKSSKIYEIPQSPLELTWTEGRLTLPAA